MKRFLFTKLGIAIIISVFTFGFFVWQVFGSTILNLTLKTNVDLERGLIGHWTFDGPDTITNIADKSGQGNTGSLVLGASGNTSTTTAPGKIGQALEFDGTDDYVLVSNDYNSADVTISFWMKTSSNAGWIIDKFLNTGDAWGVRLFPGPDVSIYEDIGGGDVTLYRTTVGENWVYVVAMIDSLEQKLYVNGSLVGSGTDTVGGDLSSFVANLYMAQRGNGTYYNGLLDDVRIYNRALNIEEIKRLYNLGATTHINVTLKTNPDLENGLVGHWTFDGSDTISNIADVSGQDNHGALILGASGNTSTTTAPGKIGQALEFDGTDDYVDAGEPSVLDISGSNPLSVCAWVNSNAVDGNHHPILTKGDHQYGLKLDNGNGWQFFVYNSAWFLADSDSSAISNKWTHLCGTFNTSNIKLYVNSVLQADQPSVISIDDQAHSVNIGRNSEETTRFFDGLIDDARVYNRTLNIEEIKRLYNLGATTHINVTLKTNPDLENGLVGHWTMDGPDTIQNIADKSGQGNNGALILGTSGNTSTTTAPGKIGQALEFDGTDDNVTIKDSASLDITNAITVAVWIKGDNFGVNYETILNKGASEFIGSADIAYGWRMRNEGKPEFFMLATDRINLRWDTALTSNIWYHLVGTYNGSNVKIYVDGVEKAGVGTSVTSGAINTTNDDVLIGDKGGHEFDGLIDDVRVYNRALSAEEIQRLYNMGR